MALWDDSDINSADAALIFNKIANSEAPRMIGRKSNPIVGLMTNDYRMDDPEATNRHSAGIKKKIDGGKNIEITWTQPEAAPTAIGYGAGERNAITVRTTNQAAYGAGVVTITNYSETYTWEKSTFDMYKGKDAKHQATYLKNESERIIESYFAHLDGEYCGANTAAQTATKVGSILNALQADTYATIDRTDVANANLKAAFNTDQTDEPVTLGLIRRARTALKVKLSKRIIVICSSEEFETINDLIETSAGHNATQMKDDTLTYSGEYFVYGNTVFVHAHRLAAGTMIFLNPDTWQVWFDEKPFTMDGSGITRNPNYKALMQASVDFRAALVCLDPGQNGVWYNVNVTT